MIKLERILFATDFSEYADDARQYACELADRFHAELHALHVIEDIYSYVPDVGMGVAYPAFIENLPALREQQELEAMKMLSEQIEASFEKDNRVVIATRFGAPFLEIIKYAREHFVDLIVMGTHGRTGLKHVLVGSVAENVVRKSYCPVMTIRHEQSQDTDASETSTASSSSSD